MGWILVVVHFYDHSRVRRQILVVSCHIVCTRIRYSTGLPLKHRAVSCFLDKKICPIYCLSSRNKVGVNVTYTMDKLPIQGEY